MIKNTLLRTTAAALISAASLLSYTAAADENEIIDRVKPVGQLVIKAEDKAETTADAATANTAPEAAAPAAAGAGKATYDTACFACHGTGVAGAPILGKKDAWADRISKGKEALYTSAINGLNAMPAKGGSTSLSDEDIKAVVDYMVEQSS